MIERSYDRKHYLIATRQSTPGIPSIVRPTKTSPSIQTNTSIGYPHSRCVRLRIINYFDFYSIVNILVL